jgi:hypothetical protein
VRCHSLLDLKGFGGTAKDPIKLTRRDGQQGIAPEEQHAHDPIQMARLSTTSSAAI